MTDSSQDATNQALKQIQNNAKLIKRSTPEYN